MYIINKMSGSSWTQEWCWFGNPALSSLVCLSTRICTLKLSSLCAALAMTFLSAVATISARSSCSALQRPWEHNRPTLRNMQLFRCSGRTKKDSRDQISFVSLRVMTWSTSAPTPIPASTHNPPGWETPPSVTQSHVFQCWLIKGWIYLLKMEATCRTPHQSSLGRSHRDRIKKDNLDMPVLLCQLPLLIFHQVLHGVAGRADVGLLLGWQLCLQIHHLLLQAHNLTPLILHLSRQSFHVGSMILLEPVIHRMSLSAAWAFGHSDF